MSDNESVDLLLKNQELDEILRAHASRAPQASVESNEYYIEVDNEVGEAVSNVPMCMNEGCELEREQLREEVRTVKEEVNVMRNELLTVERKKDQYKALVDKQQSVIMKLKSSKSSSDMEFSTPTSNAERKLSRSSSVVSGLQSLDSALFDSPDVVEDRLREKEQQVQ
jgi:hypothetical protein